MEPGALRLRDAEQLADDAEWKWVGESLDEVHRGTGSRRGELVEQCVGDSRDRWFQRRDARRRERGRHQPAQAGVVGRIDVEHVPAELGAGQSLGDHVRIRRERGHHVLGESGILQGLAHRVVAEDHVRVVAVGQTYRLDRAARRVASKNGYGSSRTASTHPPQASGSSIGVLGGFMPSLYATSCVGAGRPRWRRYPAASASATVGAPRVPGRASGRAGVGARRAPAPRLLAIGTGPPGARDG